MTRGRSKPAWSALAVLSLALCALPLGLPAAAAAPVCAVDLPAPVRGANAVAALSDELPTVAHAAGLSARNLEHNLRTDRTLWVDECGRPYYVEPAESGPSTPEPVSAAPDDALTLHSRPGSALTFFLDFDGHAISATAWSAAYGGDFTAEPYSMDSDPAFNQTELSRIESAWRRVAEDYAPFDVDVTTEDPGTAAIDRSSASDDHFGTRVVISGTNTIYSQCSCGGIAYIGVFDATGNHSCYQPAFVFTRGVGVGSKGIAESASHEAGHNLGLYHDGTASSSYYPGQGAWAPVMGVGYYKPLSQWSVGEYAGANNTQDDLKVIAGNGPSLVADDVGDSRDDAVDLSSGTTSAAITARDDIDWFRFDAVGATTVTVTPQSPGGNLDAALEVYNAAGTQLAVIDEASAFLTSDSAAGLGATVTLTLPAGRYYAKVDGVGAGSPQSTGYSDYGSLGRYDLTLDTTTPLVIRNDRLPDGTVGAQYTASLQATGGQQPYAWGLVGGELPAGLTLTDAGTLQGTPTTSGSYTFAVRVADSSDQSDTASVQIVVDPAEQQEPAPQPSLPPSSTVTAATPIGSPTAAELPAQAPPLRITTRRLPRAIAGTRYRQRLSALGSGPMTWKALTVPRGLRVRTNGVLRGKPRRPGRYLITVAVLDSNGHTASSTLRLRVRAR